MVQTTFCSIQPPAGSGKTMGTQEQMIRTTATHTNNAVAVQAEVVMNAYYRQLFSKSIKNKNQHGYLGNENQLPLLIYPNPAQNVINIKYWGKGKKETTVEIFDIYGRQVSKTSVIMQNPISLSILELPNGMYYCVVKNNNNVVAVQKLAVLK